MNRFRDRREGGRLLGEHLRRSYGSLRNLLVLGLPRGGVPVAAEVATALGAPLDVFLVRKLGVPGQEELAMGAIAEGGVRVMNPSVLAVVGVDGETIERTARREQIELDRRAVEYRGHRPPPDVRGRTVILVDDGLATGSTMRAAAAAIRKQDPDRLIVAVPVAARETCDILAEEVDEVECLRMPEPFHAVGLWYDDFGQTTDEEVRELLGRAWSEERNHRNDPDAATRGER